MRLLDGGSTYPAPLSPAICDGAALLALTLDGPPSDGLGGPVSILFFCLCSIFPASAPNPDDHICYQGEEEEEK